VKIVDHLFSAGGARDSRCNQHAANQQEDCALVNPFGVARYEMVHNHEMHLGDAPSGAFSPVMAARLLHRQFA
jgi:hypothetical protein